MHLLRHLRVSLLLDLGFPSILDTLDPALNGTQSSQPDSLLEEEHSQSTRMEISHLPACLLLVLHLLLLGLHGLLLFPLLKALLVCRETSGGSECLFLLVPLLACDSTLSKGGIIVRDAVTGSGEIVPFLRMPWTAGTGTVATSVLMIARFQAGGY